MSSRSGRGDTRANGDVDSPPPPRSAPVILPPPDPDLLTPSSRDELVRLLTQQCEQQRVAALQQTLGWNLRMDAISEDLAAWQQQPKHHGVPIMVEALPHDNDGVNVDVAILEGGIILQPHTKGDLDPPFPEDRAHLGILGEGGISSQPHTDVALLLIGVPASPAPSPHVLVADYPVIPRITARTLVVLGFDSR